MPDGHERCRPAGRVPQGRAEDRHLAQLSSAEAQATFAAQSEIRSVKLRCLQPEARETRLAARLSRSSGPAPATPPRSDEG